MSSTRWSASTTSSAVGRRRERVLFAWPRSGEPVATGGSTDQVRPTSSTARQEERGPHEPTVTGSAPSVGNRATVAMLDSLAGEPLPRELRGRMQVRLGIDLGRVRAHTGAEAARAADAVDA